MKNVRQLAFALALATSALSVACSGGTTDAQQPQTSASALTVAPVGVNTHGAVKRVADALSNVPLRADQRTEIEKLVADGETRQATVAAAHKDVMLAFADQIEKGSIDKSALQTKIDAASAAHANIVSQNQAALTRLHELLTPDQRNNFVDAMQSGHKEWHEHGAKHGFSMMKQWKDDLKLTDDQVSQIKDVLHGEHKGRDMKAVGKDFKADMEARKNALETFRTDKFDAEGLVHPIDMNKGRDRMFGVAEKILPILTAEQRTIAANKIREMAAKGEMGPLGH